MICAIVEHFLIDQGRDYFSEWVETVRSLVESNENYISIQAVSGINVKTKSLESRRCIIEVKFKSLPTLIDWVASDQHAHILALLEKYVILERKTTLYEYKH